ncbi:hypothetical protein F5876DRAFT_90460 [Lentinula aff. lateritia]|uniref:Uncharacterized protein n=1 Tax=Lentinula aff. lateritia TaxID=2804960 RepID=A0ACC1TSW7_9AGAR|nr:hypothetical protein F5876DRAFT_90460 [Lentinula aff. lateritia]
MPEEYSHLCVVCAFARWITILKVTNGYLFRKICANDRIAEVNEPMTSEQFLEMFRNNLIDIGVDHWGGWSQEFTHLTIVKYLISLNDNPTINREDFFNLNYPPASVCPVCNRSCHCA